MRVLAARFPDRKAAAGVLAQLQDRYSLGPRDADIAPLGGTDQPARHDMLLAGRFHDERVQEVIQVIEGCGGEVLANVPEQWTRRGPSTPARGDGGTRREWSTGTPSGEHQYGSSGAPSRPRGH